ncbi:DUF1640-domain-containing protein [Protomyces lactucae-debilis]|uniref:DUF1640-domain-containing protein n=1 Tax=Protomyces lactucae-debilis TaxID=2754530 RepID=A0A1Y2FS66_PROLT|nr:DUF1640-domain-containing protein [Protomyces lactucae-debilis]ORY85555.1 DUF1640-domain-containing protein [Protomyces lactucae-debilis]
MAARALATRHLIRATSQHRAFAHSALLREQRYHFDTLKFVKKLEAEGFSASQSQAAMRALSDVISESIDGLRMTLVSKEEQEKTTYTQKVDFAKLRSELQTLEKNDHSLVKSDQDRIISDLEKLKQRLKEEIAKTQANVRLDLNLEKGRIREESSIHELKIRETDTKIDTEIANIRTQLETVKFQMLQWFAAFIAGVGSLVLAFMRFIQ